MGKMNENFMHNLGRYLNVMERYAKRLNAPVINAEFGTKRPFEILVYTVLSSRTKDETTIEAFKRIMKVGNTPKTIAKLSEKKLERLIKPVGFYRVKAKNLKMMCKMLNTEFGGKVPKNADALMSLPGVGIKTANIVLARVFGHDVIGVDTHVHRICNRIGIVKTKTPAETSKILNEIIEKKYRRKLNRIFVGFGQVMCTPISPKCSICPLFDVCERRGVEKYRNIYNNKL